MLLGPLASVAYQTVLAPRKDSEQDGKLPLLNTCHALASTGPVVERLWPDHYEGIPDPEAGKEAAPKTRSG